VLHKENDDWVKKCIEYEVEDARPRGKPNRIWRKVMQKEWQTCRLNGEDAMEEADKRMVDDQHRCEWVNVSSGIDSPG